PLQAALSIAKGQERSAIQRNLNQAKDELAFQHTLAQAQAAYEQQNYRQATKLAQSALEYPTGAPQPARDLLTQAKSQIPAWYRQPMVRRGSGLGLVLLLVWGVAHFWPESSTEATQHKETAEVGPVTNEPASQPTTDLLLNLADYGLPNYELILIDSGSFKMGSDSGESDEKPIYRVSLSSFQLGKTEVTQELWQAVMGSNPSYFKGDRRPVENVSWETCQEFIQKLNQKTGLTFRLPTEAEWEYAAGGGSTGRTSYAGTDNSNSLGTYAWYVGNSNSKTHPVGQKKPNPLGLYDLSGNVWEWCQDWYGDYPREAQTNPTEPEDGSDRVLRGGSWYSYASYCRVAFRYSYHPDYRSIFSGFRLSRTL
ncbi:MAG: formylglycine-generating enzyme family protein, partial [Bacteroidota bacterium]